MVFLSNGYYVRACWCPCTWLVGKPGCSGGWSSAAFSQRRQASLACRRDIVLVYGSIWKFN